MKKTAVVLIVAVPLAILAWWIYHRKTEPLRVDFAKARIETLISTLPTNGKVEPIEWAPVRAEVAGVVTRLMVQEGQKVTKGSVLAQLSSLGALAELTRAEASLAQAQAEQANVARGGRTAELAEIENSLSKAKFERDAAQREYATARRLEEKQAETHEAVEAARGKLREAEIDIESLERKRAALVSSTDRSIAEARRKEAQAAVELAQRRIAEAVIRSPLSGVVYNLPIRAGVYINVGDLVANVGRLDKLRVRVYVDEPELGRVAAGDPVTITWDALPGKQWSGMVERMPTQVQPLGTRQVGEVLCTIDNPNRELVPGTNVDANIRTGMVLNALTVPKESLRHETRGVGVFLLRDDAVYWRSVKIGASSVTRAEITEGLAAGNSVALPTEHLLKDGMRVKPNWR